MNININILAVIILLLAFGLPTQAQISPRAHEINPALTNLRGGTGMGVDYWQLKELNSVERAAYLYGQVPGMKSFADIGLAFKQRVYNNTLQLNTTDLPIAFRIGVGKNTALRFGFNNSFGTFSLRNGYVFGDQLLSGSGTIEQLPDDGALSYSLNIGALVQHLVVGGKLPKSSIYAGFTAQNVFNEVISGEIAEVVDKEWTVIAGCTRYFRKGFKAMTQKEIDRFESAYYSSELSSLSLSLSYSILENTQIHQLKGGLQFQDESGVLVETNYWGSLGNKGYDSKSAIEFVFGFTVFDAESYSFVTLSSHTGGIKVDVDTARNLQSWSLFYRFNLIPKERNANALVPYSML